jgi:hypothetical protein
VLISPAIRRAIVRVLFAAAAALAVALAAAAQEEKVSLKDPEDGALDFSAFLSTRTGFLPVPLIVTEPAVGFGGGLFPLFIRRTPPDPDAPEKAFPTPTLFGAGGFGTVNGSWGAFGGYLIPLRGDRIRWTGGAAYLDLNLKFFGFGPDSPLQENPVSFDITRPRSSSASRPVSAAPISSPDSSTCTSARRARSGDRSRPRSRRPSSI